MSAIDDPKTLGRARLSFADQHDIDEFIATLEKFERGEIGPAFPWNTAPRYLLHDRDGLFVNEVVSRRVASLGISDRRTAPHAPWQNPYAERLIGSIRRECLDHLIVWHEGHLRRTLAAYFAYYDQARTHLGLSKDAPAGRSVQPPAMGRIVAKANIGGLHHHYERRAA